MSGSTTLGTSGQGGYLLPSGFLSTSGSQIVDANGNPVRIASIGWNGPDGAAGGILQGLNATSFQTILNAIKADGFNTVRIPWSDVTLTSMPASGAIDFTQNPALRGLNTLQIFQQVVAYAGQIGMKIIFDHHTNDGGYNGWGGQQVNGLWFDSGPGTDGTDGSNTTGTVTAAKFQQNTVTLAKTFAGNATVIGYDLDNEPTSASNINWGQGGPTDIQAMYTTVGNAVEAAAPGVLIIAEGPQQYPAPSANSGMDPNVKAPEGDLTGVKTKPVVLTVPNKVVYSVHEYPSPISGTGFDSGPSYIQQMNAAWGYLVTQNIAPVWIGEMGASLDGTADSAGAGLADEQAWAKTLLDYMNGKDGSQGGPTFTGNQQPVSGSWWLAGSEPGQYPNGIQAAWGTGNYRPEQQAITNQMLFIPKTTILPPSANYTVVLAGSTAAIVDASANKWTITSGGQVAVNGTTDTTTGNVIEIAYVNGAIWQENTGKLWWSKTQPGAAWGPDAGTATSPLPTVSANNTVVLAGSTAAIVDANANKWTITSGGQVAVNGTTDTTTGNVIELAYVNGVIWQENSGKLWWGKAQPGAAWGPDAGTAVSPLPVVLDTLVLRVSEDAYLGDAQYTVSVNGTQVGATRTTTASHTAGQSDAVTLTGTFGAAPTIVVTFTNDAYGGAGLDRNLYVDGITYNGVAQVGSATLLSNGSAGFALHGSAPSTPKPAATLSLTDDAGKTVSLGVITSGSQVSLGGTQTTLHGNVRQAIDSSGVVNISTDTAGTGIVAVNTKDVGGASYHLRNFATTNVELGGATAGSLTIDGAAGGTIMLDSGNYAVSIADKAWAGASTAKNTFTVTLGGSGTHSLLIDDTGTNGLARNVITAGSGTDTMRFISAAANTVSGGSGTSTIVAAGGTGSFIAGSGTMDVTGGTGAAAYTFHAGAGLLKIEDFSTTRGQTLTVDKALQGAATETSDGHGGLMLSFGTTNHGIDLLGVSSFALSQIRYV